MEEEINSFIIFCIEAYKEKDNQSGADVYNLFKEKGVLEYLRDGYDVLHTQGMYYLIDDIAEFIENH